MLDTGTKALLYNEDLLENGGKTKTGDEEKQNKQCPHLQPPNLPFVRTGTQTHCSPFFTMADVFQLSFNLREAEWESAQ